MTTATSRNSVKTGTVKTRRRLRFESIDQAIAEAERLAAADLAGTAQCMGNWKVGQILNHTGAWAELAFGGNPIRMPWFVRLFGPAMLRRFLKNGLPAGHNIPRVPGGTIATEMVPTPQGLARFRAGYTRLNARSPRRASSLLWRDEPRAMDRTEFTACRTAHVVCECLNAVHPDAGDHLPGLGP